MLLDNTTSIKDIITSLQNMQGINAKADIASVVGAPATADDSVATITNTVQQAKDDLADKTGQVNTEPLQTLVDKMVVGKKWASGLAEVKVGSLSKSGGSLTNQPVIEVTGLDFRPSIIIVPYGPTMGSTRYIQSETQGGNEIFAEGSNEWYLAQVGSAYVNYGGFCIKSPTSYTSGSRKWWAFE